MSRRAAGGNGKLSALDHMSGQIQKQGFQTADLLSAFVKTVDTDGKIDPEARSSTDSDLKAELLQGRVKVLTKTDSPTPALSRG